MVVSSDGGQHWSQYEVREQPVSLFFLDETTGWMVTDHGLWSTVESGRTWTKLENRKGILQVYFLDANHGYITGTPSLVDETLDGGKTWTKLPQAANASVSARVLTYDSITFVGQHGIIVGEIDPAAPLPKLTYPAAVPSDLDSRRRHVIVLETLDGGKKWVTDSIPLEAGLARLRLSKQGFVLALLEFTDAHAALASAVFQAPFGQPHSHMIFGERDRAVTDVALIDDGGAIVVAVEPPGNSPQVPIPGKLKILESRDLKVWQEMDVDYRAVAQTAVLAVARRPSHLGGYRHRGDFGPGGSASRNKPETVVSDNSGATCFIHILSTAEFRQTPDSRSHKSLGKSLSWYLTVDS